MPHPAPLLSVVIPIYNEAVLLPELKQRCQRALESMTPAFEIILWMMGARTNPGNC